MAIAEKDTEPTFDPVLREFMIEMADGSLPVFIQVSLLALTERAHNDGEVGQIFERDLLDRYRARVIEIGRRNYAEGRDTQDKGNHKIVRVTNGQL